jgi:hypothetical protein
LPILTPQCVCSRGNGTRSFNAPRDLPLSGPEEVAQALCWLAACPTPWRRACCGLRPSGPRVVMRHRGFLVAPIQSSLQHNMEKRDAMGPHVQSIGSVRVCRVCWLPVKSLKQFLEPVS